MFFHVVLRIVFYHEDPVCRVKVSWPKRFFIMFYISVLKRGTIVGDAGVKGATPLALTPSYSGGITIGFIESLFEIMAF